MKKKCSYYNLNIALSDNDIDLKEQIKERAKVYRQTPPQYIKKLIFNDLDIKIEMEEKNLEMVKLITSIDRETKEQLDNKARELGYPTSKYVRNLIIEDLKRS